jgi:hypothetical protein
MGRPIGSSTELSFAKQAEIRSTSGLAISRHLVSVSQL